jgi:hypothetical protein
MSEKDPRMPLWTFVHEFGHGIEHTHPTVHKALIAFLEERSKGEPVKKMSELTGNSNYKDYEVGVKDHFPYAYCGKDYGGYSTELLSMGLQYMQDDPEKFLRKDPEYFQLIYDIMVGVYNV